jgi:hypothetical protein
MVTVTGGNSRTIRRKDMEHRRVLMETDSSGNTVMVIYTGMEYSEKYITESTKRKIMMVKDITGGEQMAMNIGDSSRMTCYREKESHKRREYSTK